MKCPACDQRMPKKSELLLHEEIKELKLRCHVERTRADSYRAVLRDQFAMAALTGFAKNYRSATGYTKGGNIDKGMALDAKLAYGLADAMMKARETAK